MIEYSLVDKVAVLTVDDGKANAVGHKYIDGYYLMIDPQTH